ncbi:MAG: hypothetical protein JXO22_05010 [Phycisphaerae bacterium]|nr:hypothetical protein [Phycisphaerae bacterium]
MRYCLLAIMGLGLNITLVGCAAPSSREALLQKDPIPAELPTLAKKPRQTLTYRVGVEGRQPAPRLSIVAPPHEYEYTAEERELLGLDERSGHNYLEFYRPVDPNSRVSTDRGGVEPGVVGRGGAAPGISEETAVVGTTGWGGAAPGTDSATRVAGVSRSPGGARPGKSPATSIWGIQPATRVVGPPQKLDQN